MPDPTHNVPSGASAPPAIELANASKVFGNFAALRRVTLSIPAGTSVVLLGENGAGKSTLMKLVSGLWSPTFGSVRVFGEPPTDQRGRIATMGHASMLYDELTGLENLEYIARLHAAQDRAVRNIELSERAAEALRDVGLDPANQRRVGEYSQGMRQRAALARVLLIEPDILLLDEPFSNLDVRSSAAIIERLQAWLAATPAGNTPRTLLLITHQAALAQPLAGITITLEQGAIAAVEPRQTAEATA